MKTLLTLTLIALTTYGQAQTIDSAKVVESASTAQAAVFMRVMSGGFVGAAIVFKQEPLLIAGGVLQLISIISEASAWGQLKRAVRVKAKKD